MKLDSSNCPLNKETCCLPQLGTPSGLWRRHQRKPIQNTNQKKNKNTKRQKTSPTAGITRARTHYDAHKRELVSAGISEPDWPVWRTTDDEECPS